MIIKKSFRAENAHVVRNCTSERCSLNIHGHSYLFEIFLTSDSLDGASMIMDFGLLKGTVKDIIDSFDHAYSMWNKESDEFQEFIKKNNARYIIMPVSPSAEMISLMFFFIIDKILQNTQFNNGEGNIQLSSVRVHETATGYAESFREDLKMWDYQLEDIIFSQQIKEEWKDPEMYNKLINHISFVNPIITPTHK